MYFVVFLQHFISSVCVCVCANIYNQEYYNIALEKGQTKYVYTSIQISFVQFVDMKCILFCIHQFTKIPLHLHLHTKYIAHINANCSILFEKYFKINYHIQIHKKNHHSRFISNKSFYSSIARHFFIWQYQNEKNIGSESRIYL